MLPTFCLLLKYLIPPFAGGQAFQVGPVCVSVCLSVRQRSCGCTVWHIDSKFGVGFYIDDSSDYLDSQHVKVASLKKNMTLKFRKGCPIYACGITVSKGYSIWDWILRGAEWKILSTPLHIFIFLQTPLHYYFFRPAYNYYIWLSYFFPGPLLLILIISRTHIFFSIPPPSGSQIE